MSNTLTPEQKALVKAATIAAELDCTELQKVLTRQAISGAKRRMRVAEHTRSARIDARIADKLALARAVQDLSEAERQLLSPSKPTKSDKSDNKPQKTTKSKGNDKATQTDVSVQ